MHVNITPLKPLLAPLLLALMTSSCTSTPEEYNELAAIHIKLRLSPNLSIVSIYSLDKKHKIRTGAFYVKVLTPDQSCLGVSIDNARITKTQHLSSNFCNKTIEGGV